MKSIPSPRSSCTLVLDRFVAPLTSEAVQALAGARAWPGRSTVEPDELLSVGCQSAESPHDARKQSLTANG